MLALILNAIYRQFLKAAVPGMARLGQGDDRGCGSAACFTQYQRFLGSCIRRLPYALGEA